MTNQILAEWLPPWALVFAFVASAFLVLIQIGKLVWEFFKKPCLELILTKEFFVRVIADGEVFFLNSVALSRFGNVLIEDIDFMLEKTDAPQKKYQLKLGYVGDKVSESGNRVANFYWHSTSPKDFIPADEPKRAVYTAVLSHYADGISSCMREFHSKCAELKAELNGRLVSELTEVEAKKTYSDITACVAKAKDGIAKSVQLEKGNYKLVLNVSYQPITQSPLFRGLQSASSAIEFEVLTDVSNYINSIEEMLIANLRMTVLGEKIDVFLPEYQPVNVREIKQKK